MYLTLTNDILLILSSSLDKALHDPTSKKPRNQEIRSNLWTRFGLAALGSVVCVLLVVITILVCVICKRRGGFRLVNAVGQHHDVVVFEPEQPPSNSGDRSEGSVNSNTYADIGIGGLSAAHANVSTVTPYASSDVRRFAYSCPSLDLDIPDAPSPPPPPPFFNASDVNYASETRRQRRVFSVLKPGSSEGYLQAYSALERDHRVMSDAYTRPCAFPRLT
ncbi:uncharacterized protein [Littorina saxatilis]|uniref:uncharacterized protein n=1 Tax=Littorina saxatilis TaxID=31220 RepID=UPI0038B429F5